MIPVSSTVIPLPVYKVGYDLGFISKDKKAQSSFKPEDGIKLITSKYNKPKIMKSCFRDEFSFLAIYVTFSFPPILANRDTSKKIERVN